MSRLFMEHSADAANNTPVKAKLKWFNPGKGFGFVAQESGDPDAFLHISVLHNAGLQHLGENAEILCTVVPGQRGPQVERILEVLDHGLPPTEGGGGEGGYRDAPRGGRRFADEGNRFSDRGFGGGRDRFSDDRGGGRDFGGGRDRFSDDRGGGRDFGGGRDRFSDDRGGGRDFGGGRDRFSDDRGGGRDFGGGRDRFDQGAATGGDEQGTVKWFKPDKGFGFVVLDNSGKDVFVHKSILRKAGIYGLEPGQKVKMKVHQVEKGHEASWIKLLD
ncbi:MAG: cold-shock protein [Alphaproteobacteria bacterium]